MALKDQFENNKMICNCVEEKLELNVMLFFKSDTQEHFHEDTVHSAARLSVDAASATPAALPQVVPVD